MKKTLLLAASIAALTFGSAFAEPNVANSPANQPVDAVSATPEGGHRADPKETGIAPAESEKPAAVTTETKPDEGKPTETAPKGEVAAAPPEKSMSEIFNEAGIDPRCTARDPIWFDALGGCASLSK